MSNLVVKARENKVKRIAKKKGFYIKKLKASEYVGDWNGYMIFDSTKKVILGKGFDLCLDEVENFLS